MERQRNTGHRSLLLPGSLRGRPLRRALRAVPSLAVSLTAALLLAGCGGDGEPAAKGNPFAGTWRSGEGAAAGAGGTTLTVDENGGVRFKSSVDCTGTAAESGTAYKFSIDCGSSKFTGTASPPRSGAFTMTWTDGDTSEYRTA